MPPPGARAQRVVVLRHYRRADFDSLWALDQECFPAGIAYSRGELRAFLAGPRAETIVAERDGRAVAFVLGRRRAHAWTMAKALDAAEIAGARCGS